MKQIKRTFTAGVCSAFFFCVWTMLVQIVDVQSVGVNGTTIGFASFNSWFHSLTGVNMNLYTLTDWFGLVPLIVCLIFGITGFVQLIKRKSFFNVDSEIIISGVYYLMVILCYFLFEAYPVNYRPILINGFAEASYPSSTTLLTLTVMPTFAFLLENRMNSKFRNIIGFLAEIFSVFMVAGRLISGVHWITDIIGSLFLSAGLFCIYKAIVLFFRERRKNNGI